MAGGRAEEGTGCQATRRGQDGGAIAGRGESSRRRGETPLIGHLRPMARGQRQEKKEEEAKLINTRTAPFVDAAAANFTSGEMFEYEEKK